MSALYASPLIRRGVSCFDPTGQSMLHRFADEAWHPRNARESFWIRTRHRRLPSVAVGGTPSCAQCGCHAQRVFESCVLRCLYVIRIAIDPWAGAMLCPDRGEHASPRRGGSMARAKRASVIAFVRAGRVSAVNSNSRGCRRRRPGNPRPSAARGWTRPRLGAVPCRGR